ncbi:hypothetical protein G7084_05335 [Weissella coleopterorum]|uniref:Uncharacterized protein n=1 Tax=Weissella coleopterorum TaxID=2714949 RepID=A0A6G8B0E8_9LACO|nr:hypothetical protein [Weissella coleopterorum]QIL50784.1 hypothetical protein G7084_05335 [Weissella coleopterorum]
MKNKKWWLIGSVVVILLVLGGAAWTVWTSQKANDSRNPDQDQSSRQSAKTNSIKPLQDGAKNKTNERTYQITDAEKNSAQYVANGALTKVGQYSISPAGNRTELQQINEQVNQKLSIEGLTYVVKKVKVQLNQPKTDEALEMAQMAFNDRSLSGNYQTLILNYSITNQTGQVVKTDGLKAVKISEQHVVTVQSGLDNDAKLSQISIQPGSTVETFATVLVGSNDGTIQNLKTVNLNFAAVLDQKQNNITDEQQTKMTMTF